MEKQRENERANTNSNKKDKTFNVLPPPTHTHAGGERRQSKKKSVKVNDEKVLRYAGARRRYIKKEVGRRKDDETMKERRAEVPGKADENTRTGTIEEGEGAKASKKGIQAKGRVRLYVFFLLLLFRSPLRLLMLAATRLC